MPLFPIKYKHGIVCECGGVSSTVPNKKAIHEATVKHTMWVNGQTKHEPLPRQRYPIKKIKCDCGGMTSTIPSFKSQHENTNKHVKWVEQVTNPVVITQPVEITQPVKITKKQIINCPCGSTDTRTNRHIASERHKIWITTNTIIETRGRGRA